jgi:lipid-A-disaccharide synthase-like uncharacterized protein
MIQAIKDFWAHSSQIELIWLVIGFSAQMMFSARFLVQSIVPQAFWYFSFAGGVMLLAYAIHRKDPVFTLGQAFGLLVYSRNIWFIWNTPREGDKENEARDA